MPRIHPRSGPEKLPGNVLPLVSGFAVWLRISYEISGPEATAYGISAGISEISLAESHMEFLGGRGGGAGPLPSSGGMTVGFGMENADDACT